MVPRFKNCPNWPIATNGINENEVFILAVELKKQQHGDFSEENNVLVKTPEMMGAKKVRFIRVENIEKLLGKYEYKTGYADKIPCGTNCQKCPLFKKPCPGCPAIFNF